MSRHGLNLTKVDVCAISGKMPNSHCPRKSGSWFIPGVSPISTCEVHREVLVDERTGKRLCSPSTRARPVVMEFWPSDLLKVFRQSGLARREPPPFEEHCGIAAKGKGTPPSISSPLAGVSYMIQDVREEVIAFSAVTDADAAWLYWFVDDRLLDKAPNGKPLFWRAQPGRFLVRVVDDHGRSDSRELIVARP